MNDPHKKGEKVWQQPCHSFLAFLAFLSDLEIAFWQDINRSGSFHPSYQSSRHICSHYRLDCQRSSCIFPWLLVLRKCHNLWDFHFCLMPMPSARPKFFWPAKIKFWLAKNNLAGQKHQNPIQKWRSKKFWLAKFFFGRPKIFLVKQMASAIVIFLICFMSLEIGTVLIL